MPSLGRASPLGTKTTGFLQDERFVTLTHKHRGLMPLAN